MSPLQGLWIGVMLITGAAPPPVLFRPFRTFSVPDVDIRAYHSKFQMSRIFHLLDRIRMACRSIVLLKLCDKG